jgi:hypothetical protein
VRTEDESPETRARFRRSFIIGLVLLILALSVGITIMVLTVLSDNGAERAPLSTAEYFQRLEASLAESDRRFAELQREYQLSGEELQDPATAVEINERAHAIISGTLDEVSRLRPPEDVQGDHDRFVTAASLYLDNLESFVQRLRGAGSAAEVRRLYEGIPGSALDQTATALDSACFILQDRADEAGAGVELGCGE